MFLSLHPNLLPFVSVLFHLLLLLPSLSASISLSSLNHVVFYQLHALQNSSQLCFSSSPSPLCPPATSGFHHGRHCSCFPLISPAGQPSLPPFPSFCLNSHSPQICLVFSMSFFPQPVTFYTFVSLYWFYFSFLPNISFDDHI